MWNDDPSESSGADFLPKDSEELLRQIRLRASFGTLRGMSIGIERKV